MWLENFDYRNYSNILKNMKEIGEIYNFNLVNNSVKNGYILRHDIDLSIEKAYEMSRIEKDMNVTATYFILVTSELYNVQSYKNRNIIKDMHLNGFEIGLHFDPIVYGDITSNQMQNKVENECSVIEDIIGTKVHTISLHNPSIHNQYPIFDGYKNAYSKEFFNPDLYISDSCKDFRGKEISTFIKKGEDNLLQVLFHPIHFSEKEENYIQSFNKIIESKINYFDKGVRGNKTYKKEIGEDNLLNYFTKYIREKS